MSPGLDICPTPRIENVAPRMRTVRRILETSDVLSGVTITVGLKKQLVDLDLGGQLFDFPVFPEVVDSLKLWVRRATKASSSILQSLPSSQLMPHLRKSMGIFLQ